MGFAFFLVGAPTVTWLLASHFQILYSARSVVRFAILVLTAFVYPVMRLLQWLRVRKELDSWRRTVGLGLRSEGTKFVLSAFGLNAPPDLTDRTFRSFVQSLAAVLRREPATRVALVHHLFWVEQIVTRELDITFGRFRVDGTLASMETDLDPRVPLNLSPTLQEEINQIVLTAHRETRQLPETIRPRKLWERAFVSLAAITKNRGVRPVVHAYAKRALRAWFISVESIGRDASSRFSPPDFRLRRNLGSGGFNAVCRVRPGAAAMDLWLQIHHAALDGAAVQELLSRLENHLGKAENVLFPEGADAWGSPHACEIPKLEPRLSVVTEYLDFQPLLRERKLLNKAHAAKLGGEIPVVVLLLWKLVQQPEFTNRRFAVAVDVPADQRFGRAVDLISVAPESPSGAFTEGELGAFSRTFNELVEAARHRATSTYQAARQLAVLPSWLAHCALRFNRAGTRSVFGTVGISVLRDAKVFVAPMSDSGFDEGFLAIGSFALPSRSHSVGCVTFKGPLFRITPTIEALHRALIH